MHPPNRRLQKIKCSEVAHGVVEGNSATSEAEALDQLRCASGEARCRVNLAFLGHPEPRVPRAKETHLLNQKATPPFPDQTRFPMFPLPLLPPHPTLTLHLWLLRPRTQRLLAGSGRSG